MAISAHDPQDRVEQLILLTDRLTELVAQAAQAFEQRRPQDAAIHVGETARLANLYRHESARVRANPELVAAAPLVLRTRLIRATEAFDAVLARQGRAIEAARIITEGLVRAIADEVAVQRAKGLSYGPDATTSTTGKATAITLNQRA
ncbi:flagellar basal body protein [Phenylobacterium sp.]|uniref:flagellar basal body protein n=1 Tax=Phenylobacterium sp. TaxID=1871053 RepID=UPI0039831E5C